MSSGSPPSAVEAAWRPLERPVIWSGFATLFDQAK
jgi:hypothetical protein